MHEVLIIGGEAFIQNYRPHTADAETALSAAGVKYYTGSCLFGRGANREGNNHLNHREKTLQSRLKANRGGDLLFPLSHFTNNPAQRSHLTTLSFRLLLTWESLQGRRYGGIQQGGRHWLYRAGQSHKFV